MARLAARGSDVRCLVRDRTGARAGALERDGFELHVGDVLRPETLRGAGRDFSPRKPLRLGASA